MTEAKTLKEAIAAYGAVIADLEQPLVLERDGKPFAVLLSFEAYQRLCDRATKDEQGIPWRERFKQLLAEVQARTAAYSSEEIEAEITAAFSEVQRLNYGDRSGH